MGGHAANLGDEHREAGIALEEVLDRDVHGARPRMLLADGLGDHRRVGGKRARVVRDQHRPALGGDVLDSLDLDAEPVAVEELEQRAVEEALDPLRAPPVVDAALVLEPGQELAQVLPAHGGHAGAQAVVRSGLAHAEGGASGLGHRAILAGGSCAPG
jgi:hypothetical protein